MVSRMPPLLLALLALLAVSSWAQAAPAASAPLASVRPAEDLRREIVSLQKQLAQAEATEDRDKGPWQRAADQVARLLPVTALAWVWFVVGFGGEFVFFLRFVVQWIASERQKRTVVPMAFWHLSLIGTALVLAYAVFRIDPVFILAYSLNVLIYVRNMVIARNNPAVEALAEKSSE